MEKSRDNSMRIAATVCGLISFSILAVYIALLLRFTRKVAPLPFIWPQDSERILTGYVNRQPSREVAYVTGPYRSGKSRSLAAVAHLMRQNGRSVICFNAKTVHTIPEAIAALKNAVLRAVSESNPSAKFSEVDDICKAADAIYVKGKVSSFAVAAFFDSLEKSRDKIRPVLIISDYDSLAISPIMRPLFEAIEARLVRRNLYGDFVPVICEVMDTAFFSRESKNSLPLITAMAATKPLSWNELEILATEKYFKKSELKKAYNAFGGHMGHISECYDGLLYDEGATIDDVIKRTTNSLESKLDNIMDERMEKTAKRICKKRDRVKDISTLAPLLRKGYIVMDRNLTLHFGSKIVEKIICKK